MFISYVPIKWALLWILFNECLTHLLFNSTFLYLLCLIVETTFLFTGAGPEILKKKKKGFRWSKGQNNIRNYKFLAKYCIFYSIVKFSPFLYTMKVCQWNPISFSKFTKAYIRKEKKIETAANEKSCTMFYNRLFYKALEDVKIIINLFFSIVLLFTRFFFILYAHLQSNFLFLLSG